MNEIIFNNIKFSLGNKILYIHIYICRIFINIVEVTILILFRLVKK